MKLNFRKWLCTGAAAMLLTSTMFIGAKAESNTTTFKDIFDNPAFPKAAKINMVIPQSYDAHPTKDQIFSLNADKKARAACGDGRKAVLMKDYVAVDYEIIYYFEHGLKSFEFMGVCGAGWWAGAFGMENTFAVELSDKIDGSYKALDYMTIRDIADQDSVKAYFRADTKLIPASTRYVKLHFIGGYGPDGKERFQNWQCCPAYFQAEAYTSDQNGQGGQNNTTPTTAAVKNKTTVAAGKGGQTTAAATSTVGTNTTVANASNGSAQETTPDIGAAESNSSDAELVSQREDVSEAAAPSDAKKGNSGWIIGVVIAAVVLAGGGAGAWFFIKKKKIG